MTPVLVGARRLLEETLHSNLVAEDELYRRRYEAQFTGENAVSILERSVPERLTPWAVSP